MTQVTKEEMYECKMNQNEHNSKVQEELSLFTQSQNNMAKEFKELKQDQREFKTETKESFNNIGLLIKDGFREQNKTFSTKVEHKLTNDKISFIYRILGTIGGVIIVAIVGAILKLIIK